MRMRTALLVLLSAGTAFAQTNGFYLHPGDRVVFYGDSITDQRLYTTFTETYVVTRFPKMPITFVHSGWGGDRVTGGGGGTIDVRLDRDVTPYHPTVMTVMLGMNDGEYKPYDQTIFDKFSQGYRHLIEKARKDNPGLRVTVIEPSPFDDFTRAPRFDGGYNQTLDRYSQFVRGLAKEDGLADANLNAPVAQALVRAKEKNADLAQKLIPDSVHPGAAGHMMMAQALLKDWGATAVVTTVAIDAATGKVVQSERTAVHNLITKDSFSWDQDDECLPFPIDWADKSGLTQLAVQSSHFADELDREMLTVHNLRDSRYALKIDGAETAQFTSDELNKGINLATLSNTPMMKQAMAVHALTLQRTNVHNFRWRSIQVPMASNDFANKPAAITALDKLDDDLMNEQHKAAQPKSHHYELIPTSTR